MCKQNNNNNNNQVLAQLLVLVNPLLWHMLLAVILGVLGFLTAIFIPILGGKMLVYTLLHGSSYFWRYDLLALLICGLIRGFLRYGEQMANHYIAFKLLAHIRDQVFAALRRLCPAKLEGKDKGNLIALITSDIELLEVFYAHTISPIVIAVLTSLAMIFYISRYSLVMAALAVIAYLVIGVCIPLWIARLGSEAGRLFRRANGELSALVLENIHGLSTILQLGIGAQRSQLLEEKTREMLGYEKRQKEVAGLNQTLAMAAILIFNLIALLLGGYLASAGSISFAAYLISFVALCSSYGPVLAVSALGSTLQNTIASGRRVLDILQEEPVIAEVMGNDQATFSDVQVEHVDFSYGNETILSDFSLRIKEGELTGIVGKSGSGKSTLLKLIMRFWDVQNGSLKIGQREICTINTNDLRSLIAYVTQDTHMFKGTIAENICLANPEATREDLERVCRQAALADFIDSLPRGYDTEISELGENISGGERQRIGLARAFLSDSDLILLDEPTSNLDSLNEARILKSLILEKKQKRTMVLVSHRESTMKIADKIYSVEQGRVS